MIAFLAPDAYVRRRAVEQLTSDALADRDVAYALRRLLASDPDVAVRALAAGALGEAPALAVPWLVAALADLSPVVRDAAIRALARHHAPSAIAPLTTLAATDTTWWVRRAAIYALGVLAGDAAIAPARAALTDPFWRVRHAAVRVLALLGTRAPDKRDEILADASGGSAQYLSALWGPTLVSDVEPAPIASRLPLALTDRDPAVVTARLAEQPYPALPLVELLCDPHVPLRELAVARLVEADDLDAFAAALHWLDEPRIPHVAATVVTMLDSLGEPARELALRTLSAPARPGASRWAIGWVVAAHEHELAPLAWARACELGEPHLALRFAADADLPALLATPHAVAVADELLVRGIAVDASAHPLAAVRMRLSPSPTDADPLVRAVATHDASGLADEDPAIREAAIAFATPAQLAERFAVERDPWVRRAIARTHTDALALAADADPLIRTRGVTRLVPTRADHRARLVELAADLDPMVNAAVLDQLLATPDIEIPAWQAVTDPDAELPVTPRTLVANEPRPPRTTLVPLAPRRQLGSVSAHPLVISGAFNLPTSSLRVAAEHGVDLFFWEPSYSALTKFLRRSRSSQVVTGTYHADAASITADVDRALRRLRRDTLDVFLLFWSRSDARLDDAAFAALTALHQAGKVRAFGFSTHDRTLAMRALDRAPWHVVMTRHNAAHRGIEDALLPHAAARNASVLAFSALAYGRMVSGPDAPSASDCYRYSLAQPGVSAVISAPRRHRELVENLEVLAEPALTDATIAAIREHGARVRVESQQFNTLIRQPTRDAAAAAMAMLEHELAPGDRDEACATPASLQRSLGSRGRGRASLPSAMLRRGRL